MRTERTAMLAEANQGILRVAREIFPHTEEWAKAQEWEFFCECGRDGCADLVLLTLDAYAAARASGRPVLVDGHGWPDTRRAATA